MAACGQNGPSPTEAPQGAGPNSSRSASIPRPDLATVALGSSGPGYDGSSDFLSFASELSPAKALAAYVSQLLDAGYRDSGRQGAWRVFVDSGLTVWVRVGSAGPPTSLVVRFAPTEAAGQGDPVAHSSPAAPEPANAAGSQSIRNAPKPNDGVTSVRRPDPPHAAGQAGTGSPSGGTATGPASPGAGHSAGPAGGAAAGGGNSHDTSGGSRTRP